MHHAYVRATVGTERTPAFSMEVLKPEDGTPATAERIREAASAYLLTEEEIAAQRAEGRRRVEAWIERLEAERKALAEAERKAQEEAAASGGDGAGDGSADEPRAKRQRSRREQPPGGSGEDAA